jgi:hypothetical protein
MFYEGKLAWSACRWNSADALADLGVPQTDLHIRVARMPSRMSAGHAAEAALAV